MVTEESFDNFYHISIYGCSGEQRCLDGYSRGACYGYSRDVIGTHGMSRDFTGCLTREQNGSNV